MMAPLLSATLCAGEFENARSLIGDLPADISVFDTAVAATDEHTHAHGEFLDGINGALDGINGGTDSSYSHVTALERVFHRPLLRFARRGNVAAVGECLQVGSITLAFVNHYLPGLCSQHLTLISFVPYLTSCCVLRWNTY
jgi:hypothetical protein